MRLVCGQVDFPTATLIRTRFDTVAQARAHLHAGPAGTLLYVRDGGALAAGERVLVELRIRDGEQTRLLRGAQVASVHGEGSWVRFPQRGFVLGEVEPGLLARRPHRRLGADVACEVLVGSAAVAGRLLDVTLVGARLVGERFGLKPAARISIRLGEALAGVPSIVGPATVVWANRQGAGLYFDREDAACRASVGSLYAALQQAWQRAPESTHQRGCCEAGPLLEPPPPP